MTFQQNEPRADDAPDVILAEFPRAEGEVTRWQLREFKGAKFIDIRVFVPIENELRPTRKGATLKLRDIPKIIEQLQKIAANEWIDAPAVDRSPKTAAAPQTARAPQQQKLSTGGRWGAQHRTTAWQGRTAEADDISQADPRDDSFEGGKL